MGKMVSIDTMIRQTVGVNQTFILTCTTKQISVNHTKTVFISVVLVGIYDEIPDKKVSSESFLHIYKQIIINYCLVTVEACT